MEFEKEKYLHALRTSYKNAESYNMVESLIDSYFLMIRHMKETSLFDVLKYEERVTNASLEPMRILAYENEDLKREVNKLRKELGLCEKYKCKKRKD